MLKVDVCLRLEPKQMEKTLRAAVDFKYQFYRNNHGGSIFQFAWPWTISLLSMHFMHLKWAPSPSRFARFDAIYVPCDWSLLMSWIINGKRLINLIFTGNGKTANKVHKIESRSTSHDLISCLSSFVRLSWATKWCKQKEYSLFSASLHQFYERNSNAIVSFQHSRRRNNTHFIVETQKLETYLLVIACHPTLNMTTDYLEEKKLYFTFSSILQQKTSSFALCSLLYFNLFPLFIYLLFKLPNLRVYCFSLFPVFISLKMDRTHFVVLVVSALAWMPSMAAERFIETKYHCPKK